MNKTKRFFYTLLAGILAFVLLIVGFMPICQAVRTAHAQEEAIGDPIYYYSDSSQSESFCPLFLSGYSVVEWNYWEGEFQENLERYFWNTFYFDDITDSYFIFELSKGFQVDQKPNATALPDVLKDIFADIKAENSNNKIMLILNTNEELFYNPDPDLNKTAFLQFVDIQINTDMMTIFMYSVCEDINRQFEENEFTDIAVYINNYLMSAGFYYAMGLSHFEFYIETYPFNGKVWFNPGDWEARNADWKCAVGYADDWAMFSEWMDRMKYLVEEAYVYDEIGWSGDYEGTRFNYCYNADGVLYGTFPDILQKFISDDDLSEYNNFDGSAKVNYLPVSFGDDGWMRIPEKNVVQWNSYD